MVVRVPPAQEELGGHGGGPSWGREGPHKTGLGPTHLPVSLHCRSWGWPSSSFNWMKSRGSWGSPSSLSVSEQPSGLEPEQGPLSSSPASTFSEALEASNSSWLGSFILGRLAQTSAVLGPEARGLLAGCIYYSHTAQHKQTKAC